MLLQVYAYSSSAGREVGSWEAHDDAVACLRLPEASPDLLLSGSWDGSVRTWR